MVFVLREARHHHQHMSAECKRGFIIFFEDSSFFNSCAQHHVRGKIKWLSRTKIRKDLENNYNNRKETNTSIQLSSWIIPECRETASSADLSLDCPGKNPIEPS